MNSSFGAPEAAAASPVAFVAAGDCGGDPVGGCPANAIAPKAALNTNQYREAVKRIST